MKNKGRRYQSKTKPRIQKSKRNIIDIEKENLAKIESLSGKSFEKSNKIRKSSKTIKTATMLKNKYVISLILMAIVLAAVLCITTISKYKNTTPTSIIEFFAKYKVNYVTAGGTIKDIEKFSSYTSVSGLTLPAESEDEDENYISRKGYDLVGWYEDTSYVGEPITKIEKGTTGDKTFYALWSPSQYAFTAKVAYDNGTEEIGLPDGWDLVIGKDENGNDNVITLDKNGQTVIGKGETVSLRTNYGEDVTALGWSINEGIIFTERYQEGDKYIYYDFKMPKHNVDAIYGQSVYLDLALSPITFEENVDIGARTQNGFWYKAAASGMVPVYEDDEKGYFYLWDNSDIIYITTNNVPTQNQLTIVNETKVCFKDCNLIALDDYKNNANLRRIAGIDVTAPLIDLERIINEINNSLQDFIGYGNIIIDGSFHQKYKVDMYFDGENIINSVFSKNIHTNQSYSNTINLYSLKSEVPKIKLGTMFGDFSYNFNNVEIEEYCKDTNDFEFLLWSSKFGMDINSGCIVKAPNKSVSLATSAELSYADAEFYNMVIGNGMSLYGDSYLRVRKDLFIEYVALTLKDNSSAVIDGSISHRYQHWDSNFAVNSKGYLIVKGNFCSTTSSTFTNTTVVCNQLTVGKKLSTKNTTIIANQISNNTSVGWGVSNGEFCYTYLGSYSKELTDYDENYPYTTYYQSSNGNTSFSFNENSEIYLLGHYKTIDGKYDTSMKAIDSDNPVKKYIDALCDENGDLKENATIDKTQLIEEIKNSSNINKECMVLGNSQYDVDGKYREVIFNNAKIYAAGNLNLFNDTTVNGGEIYCKGNFSSKRDLTINDGTIEANEIGNSYNFTTWVSDGVAMWSTTKINNGKIKANKIGPLNTCLANNNIIPYGSTYIDQAAQIVGNPQIYHDVYINYIYKSSDFTNNNKINSLRFLGNYGESLSLAEEVLLELPIVTSNGEKGNWNFDNLNGETVTQIDKNGMIKNEEENVVSILDKNYISLFATKSSYKLSVKDGTERYLSLTNADYEELDLNNVKVNEDIVVELLDTVDANKTVIWYKDDSGNIHNCLPTILGDMVAFTMPPADVELYITDNMVLNLSESSYTITNNGFITELETTREDSSFEYLGNIIIEQSELTTVKTSDFSTGNKTKFTKNLIRISADVNNIESNRDILLRKILQSSSAGSFAVGLKLEDGAKAKILTDGPVQLHRVEVPENSDLILEGKNNDTSKDYIGIFSEGEGSYNKVSLGNYNGKAGNITLRNLTISPYGNRHIGEFATSNTKSSSTMTYENCSMKFTGWYSSSNIVNNMENLVINNCNFDIKSTSTWPSPLFKKVDNVSITNSNIKFLENSSTSNTGGLPLFNGISNQLLIDNSNIETSIRVPTNTSTYKTRQNPTGIAPEIKLVNNSSFITDQRVRMNRIVLEDSSTLNIGTQGDGYLLCQDIEVNDNATINAGNIYLSGFYNAKGTEAIVKDEVIAKLKVTSNLLDGKNEKGLVINGGTVNVKEFVGGDINAKIIVNNNGTLNSKNIGTSGKLYGYGTYVPHLITENGISYMEEYIYTLNKIPTAGTKVTVNGGTINVANSGYLGGMNAEVEINSGTVNLGTDSILGINETDKTTLLNDYTSKDLTPGNFVKVNVLGGSVKGNSGILNTPYATLNVSGSNTAINVKDILAENGNINISETNGKFANPYITDHGTATHTTVGVIAKNNMRGQNILISNGAVVYAKNAVANAINETDVGSLKVSYTEPKAYLYSDNYGSDGKGSITIDVNGNALLNRQYSIFYTMNDTYQDSASNPNPLYYISGQGLTLEEPIRFGYDFEGWYDETGTKVTNISTSGTGNRRLEARWKAKEVEFKISIKAGDVGLSKEQLASEIDLSKGSLNSAGDVFTYNNIEKVAYHELIARSGNIQLSNYDLKSYTIIGISIDNQTLNPEQDELDLATATVTKEIMQYYLETGKPIEIIVTEITSKTKEGN